MSSPPHSSSGFARSARMGQAPVGHLLWRFSLPAMVGMLVNATYNTVDTAFVGRLGHEAIAALTLVWPLQLTLIALAVGVGIGANSLIARRLGAGEQEEAAHAGAQAFLLATTTAVVVAAVVLVWTDPILRLLGAGPETLPLARDYLRILMWFAPVIFFPIVSNNLVRAEGNPLLPMLIIVTTALINIGLDPLLIFGLGPFPALGIRGAAVATVCARSVGCVLYIAYFNSRRSGYHFAPRCFAPRPVVWGQIYAVGAPAMAVQLSGTLVYTLAIRIVVGFGTMALAAFGVVFRLLALAFMPCIGISQGVLSLTGYNFGAGKLLRVRQVVRLGALAAAGLTTLFSVPALALPHLLVAPFNGDAEFIALTARGLRIAALLFAPVGAAIVFTTFFQGIGRALPAMFLSLARQLVFLLPALLVLPRLLGLDGFWIAMPVSDGLTVVMSLVLTVLTFRQLGVPLLGRGPAWSDPVPDAGDGPGQP